MPQIDSLKSNLKYILPSLTFCKILGVEKLPIWRYSGINFEQVEVFILKAESGVRPVIRRPRIQTRQQADK